MFGRSMLGSFGVGLLRRAMFTLRCMPFFVGLTGGMAAFDSGAGVLDALLVGIVVGALTLGLGQIASRF